MLCLGLPMPAWLGNRGWPSVLLDGSVFEQEVPGVGLSEWVCVQHLLRTFLPGQRGRVGAPARASLEGEAFPDIFIKTLKCSQVHRVEAAPWAPGTELCRLGTMTENSGG